MKACVTSIGERTRDLCIWSLERNGFEVVLYESQTSLWDKLKTIYNEMDEDFIRIDADTVPNRDLKIDFKVGPQIWWLQFMTFDWHKQNITHGGANFIKKEAIPHLRKHIEEAKDKERPESYMYRLEAFHNPRRCITFERVVGLNGYKQDDIQRIKDTKARRNQSDNYDFELAQKLSEL